MFRIFARVPTGSVGFALRAGAHTADLFRSDMPMPAILMAYVQANRLSDAELRFKRVFFDVPGLVILTASAVERTQLLSYDWVYYDMADQNGIASVIYTEGAAE